MNGKDTFAVIGHEQSFATTHWSVVLATAQADSAHSSEAWGQLARAYWPPLYAYCRRSGYGPEDAQDLTQAFFVTLLDRNPLGRLVPGQGRFRSFLLACLKNFLTDHYRHAQAARRRPEAGWLSLNEPDTEAHYQAQILDQATPELLFERAWAETLLNRAMARLQGHYCEKGKGELFDHLVTHLVRDPGAVPHAEVAAKLGTSESAVRSEMHRLRERLRVTFKEEIAATTLPDEIEDELAHVLQVLTRQL